MLSFNMSKLHIVMSDSSNNNANFSISRNRKREESSKAFRIAKNKKNVDRHVIFHDFKTQQQTMIHSIFHQHFKFDRTDNINVLNDRITKHERTTSFYKKLLYRLKLFKKH